MKFRSTMAPRGRCRARNLTEVRPCRKSQRTSLTVLEDMNMKIEPATALPLAVIPEPYIDPQEAARFLSISAKTLTRFARQGLVPAHAIGDGARRRWRFLKSELDTWMHGGLHSNHHLRSHQEETH